MSLISFYKFMLLFQLWIQFNCINSSR